MSKVVRPFSFKGLYKKIGVCGGRSIYQHANNTDIFMYYGCGRWFIGLEIGVSRNRFPSGVPSNDLLPTRCVEDGCLPSLSPSVFTASMRLVGLCCSSTQKSPRVKILRSLAFQSSGNLEYDQRPGIARRPQPSCRPNVPGGICSQVYFISTILFCISYSEIGF